MPLCSGAPTLALLRSLGNQRRKEIAIDDRAKLVALQRHWDASDAGNFEPSTKTNA